MHLDVRTGIHVGEVDLDADDLTGVAVHVGARVAALADAHEILVTTAAREAVAGMAWTFADRDVHELKGVPGDWRLWSLTSAQPMMRPSPRNTTVRDASRTAPAHQ